MAGDGPVHPHVQIPPVRPRGAPAHGRLAAAQPSPDAFPLADERTAAFALAWFTDDEAAVRGLLADDVVLLGREPLTGADAVVKFLKGGCSGERAKGLGGPHRF